MNVQKLPKSTSVTLYMEFSIQNENKQTVASWSVRSQTV